MAFLWPSSSSRARPQVKSANQSAHELRVRVNAPPVDAAAIEALLRLLADTLDCPRGKVELIRGHTSRRKVVKVHGVTVQAVLARLRAL